MSSDKREGTLFIVSAPSGAGKTSICKELIACIPALTLSVSYTTRPPRPGEQEGIDYFFISEEVFQEKIRKGELAEWAVVHGYYYGTPMEWLKSNIRLGNDILLDIDVQGAKNLKERFPQAVTIFILPPSWEVLERRLRDRMTDTPEEMQQRLNDAREEISHCREYDYIIINERLEEAIEQIRAIIIAERSRSAKVYPIIQRLFKDEL